MKACRGEAYSLDSLQPCCVPLEPGIRQGFRTLLGDTSFQSRSVPAGKKTSAGSTEKVTVSCE